MNILLTGCRGFIGQNMFNAWKHEHNIIGIDIDEEIPSLYGYDLVVHVGGISSTTERDVTKLLYYNVDYTIKLAKFCSNYGIKLQVASSAGVYGDSQSFKETDLVNPLSPYAWSKAVMEHHLNGFDNVQIFRYFNVYGPHEEHKQNQASPYFKFRKQLIEQGHITLFENSFKYKRDFIHVNNLINIQEKFFHLDQVGIWNIGTGTNKSFYDVAYEVSIETGIPLKVEVIKMPESIAKYYQPYTLADTTKLRETLNF